MTQVVIFAAFYSCTKSFTIYFDNSLVNMDHLVWLSVLHIRNILQKITSIFSLELITEDKQHHGNSAVTIMTQCQRDKLYNIII